MAPSLPQALNGAPGEHKAVKGQPVTGPAVWLGRDVLAKPEPWTHWLSEEQVAELEAAVAGVLPQVRVENNYAVNLPELLHSKEVFPLPKTSGLLAKVEQQIGVHGPGFSLIKGVPVHRWTRLQVVIAYAGIGLHLGRLKPQNEKNHIIGHVKDTGVDSDQKNLNTRIYLTRIAQPWHVDGADVAGLLCLKTAKEGGMSSIASSAALYNAVLARRPDLAEVLAGPGWTHVVRAGTNGKAKLQIRSHKQEEAVARGFSDIPVFNFLESGRLAALLSPHSYQIAEATPGVPKLSEKHKEALAFAISLLEDRETGLAADWFLEPGDIQFVNNYSVLHKRTAFRDHDNFNERRHLIRLWVSLKPEHSTDLSNSAYEESIWAGGPLGDRGGVFFEGVPLNCPLEAETPY